MHLQKVIFLVALSPFIVSAAKEDIPNKLAEFLQKPHVLPSAERAYHAVYHELDTETINGNQFGVFGQIYVALIEDQFTFGGDFETWEDSLFANGNRNCKSFMATNVIDFCDDQYFLVHQDMIALEKTVLDAGHSDLNTICVDGKNGFRNTDDPENKFVYRYKHRVPMTYKKDANSHKCIGTYDVLTDTFTCMLKKDGFTKLVPHQMQNFLWNQDSGEFAHGSGHVEVFCKKLHYKATD